MAGFLILVFALGVLTVPACAGRGRSTSPPAAERQDGELDRIRRAVEEALRATPPAGYAAVPAGVRLLRVASDGPGRTVLDFSEELLAGGRGRTLEDALHQLLTAAAAARGDATGMPHDFRVMIDGTALESHLP